MLFRSMHLLGKRIGVTATGTDGTTRCLVDVPNWDFNWQRFYAFENPIHLAGNTTLTLTCEFDNSSDNPYNPNNPPQPVSWGEATTDEMALCFLGIVLPFEFSSAKENPWGWEWPIQATNLAFGAKTADQRVRNLPSCCKPGDAEKPWKNCPNLRTEQSHQVQNR